MTLAEKLSLPVEAINQAGAYFLHKIKDFEKYLVLVKETDSIKIYRPHLFLYLQLKLLRLSETDLQDCEQFVRWCQSSGECLTKEQQVFLKKQVQFHQSQANSEKLKRLKTLLSLVERV
jgi:hypothetical protein